MGLSVYLKRIFDIFPNRQSESTKNGIKYEIPEKLRTRVLLLYHETLSDRNESSTLSVNRGYEFWSAMHAALQHFKGQFRLSKQQTNREIDDVLAFVMECSTSDFLGFIELSFKLKTQYALILDKAELIDALNIIFQHENAPFELTHFVRKDVEEDVTPTVFPLRNLPVPRTYIKTVAFPQIIVVDDQVVQKEIVAPALTVLAKPYFEAANKEFLDALKDYREGKNEDCLTKCGSSLESVLKVICKRNNWPFNENDTLEPLLNTVVDESSLESYYKQTLKITATIRNRRSTSHGGGSEVRTANRSIAQYVVSCTAAAISLIVEECDR